MFDFIAKIIFKLLKKYPKLKEKVIYYINENEKDDTNKDEITYEEKISEFKSIKAGEFALCKTPHFTGDKSSHFYRPYFIVGRSKKKLFGLYRTTSDSIEDMDTYYHTYDKKSKKKVHYECKKITVLNNDDFIKRALFCEAKQSREIIELLASITFFGNGMVDFNAFGFNPNVGSVVSIKNKFYLIYEYDQEKGFLVCELIHNDKKENYIKIANKKYVANISSKHYVNKDDIDYVIYEDRKVYLNELIKNDKKIKKTNNEKYKFGDVLSLKNTKKKIIFLSQNKNDIYYLTLEQLDLFTGISKMDVSFVNGIYRTLDKNELNKMINVLNKPLSNENNKYMALEVKNDILKNIDKNKSKLMI